MIRETASLLYAAMLAAILWLGFLVMKPFLPGIVWAAVLVVTFRPLQQRLAKALGGREGLASGLVTLLVAAFIVVPIVVAAVQVVQGAIHAYEWSETAYAEEGADLGARDRWPWIEDAVARATELFGIADVDVKGTALAAAKKVGTFAAAKAPGLIGGFANLILSFVIMLAMMVVFFAGGHVLAREIEDVLPVPRQNAARILSDLGQITRSVFISSGLTALVQALLGGLALVILGVGNAFTLTAAMFFTAVLPGGTAMVWVPVAIYLASTGHPWKAVILFAWGAGVVSTIDNFLRPYFARGGAKLPTALLVFGLLGGLLAFGLVGLFLGPIILYLVRELMAGLRRQLHGETAA